MIRFVGLLGSYRFQELLGVPWEFLDSEDKSLSERWTLRPEPLLGFRVLGYSTPMLGFRV